MSKAAKKKSGKINKAPSGKSFRYKPPAPPKKTPCPRDCGGHIVRHDPTKDAGKDAEPREWYECSNKRCNWISRPPLGQRGAK